MAAIFFINMLLLYLFFVLKGVYSWKLHLPLHLCFISGYLFMYVLVTGNQKLFRSVYFFTWIGPLPAMSGLIHQCAPTVFYPINL